MAHDAAPRTTPANTLKLIIAAELDEHANNLLTATNGHQPEADKYGPAAVPASTAGPVVTMRAGVIREYAHRLRAEAKGGDS